MEFSDEEMKVVGILIAEGARRDLDITLSDVRTDEDPYEIYERIIARIKEHKQGSFARSQAALKAEMDN